MQCIFDRRQQRRENSHCWCPVLYSEVLDLLSSISNIRGDVQCVLKCLYDAPYPMVRKYRYANTVPFWQVSCKNQTPVPKNAIKSNLRFYYTPWLMWRSIKAYLGPIPERIAKDGHSLVYGGVFLDELVGVLWGGTAGAHYHPVAGLWVSERHGWERGRQVIYNVSVEEKHEDGGDIKKLGSLHTAKAVIIIVFLMIFITDIHMNLCNDSMMA